MTCQIQAGQIAKNERDIQYLKGDIIELQARSMRDNLIFYNIKEAPNESSEVTKTLLKAFMKDELRIAEDTLSTVTFDRVHRLGKQRLYKTRPIVAKFNPYKGKEIVLSHLKNLDRKKKFGVCEQIPDEMRSRKETLMPKFQEARKKQQKPKWRQDKLLIGKEIFEPEKDKVQNINVCVLDRALDFNVTSAPPHTYNRSTFQGHVVDIKSQDDVIPALKAISMDTRVGQADHNIYAYLMCGTFQR